MFIILPRLKDEDSGFHLATMILSLFILQRTFSVIAIVKINWREQRSEPLKINVKQVLNYCALY